MEYQAFDLFDAGPDRIGEMLGAWWSSSRAVCSPVAGDRVGCAARPRRRSGSSVRPACGQGCADDAAALDPAGTVLVTGGTGGLGALVARHLVTEHGVRRLLLASTPGCGGAAAPGSWPGAGRSRCRGEFAACDAADRDGAGRAAGRDTGGAPADRGVHTAGVLDDGVISSLTPRPARHGVRPKVDARGLWRGLTRGADLAASSLFSSVAGTFGGAGQGNYAAANAFLDALAGPAPAAGLPATSLAWGLWAPGAA